MIIVGFDPGLATLGYGVIKTENGKISMLDYGAVLTPKDENLAVRLAMIEEGVKEIIKTYFKMFQWITKLLMVRQSAAILLLREFGIPNTAQ